MICTFGTPPPETNTKPAPAPRTPPANRSRLLDTRAPNCRAHETYILHAPPPGAQTSPAPAAAFARCPQPGRTANSRPRVSPPEIPKPPPLPETPPPPSHPAAFASTAESGPTPTDFATPPDFPSPLPALPRFGDAADSASPHARPPPHPHPRPSPTSHPYIPHVSPISANRRSFPYEFRQFHTRSARPAPPHPPKGRAASRQLSCQRSIAPFTLSFRAKQNPGQAGDSAKSRNLAFPQPRPKQSPHRTLSPWRPSHTSSYFIFSTKLQPKAMIPLTLPCDSPHTRARFACIRTSSPPRAP